MSFDKHNSDYKGEAWRNYSMEELGMWVALLSKRSTHRNNFEKAKKDLYDATNYLKMLEAKLEDLKEDLMTTFVEAGM